MIDVALTPEQLRDADVVVVIDALRATSTATQALAAGYRRVLFADSLDRARALRGPGRVLAGERRCVMPSDFDLGNSPRAVCPVRAEELVLATTNGAPTVIAAARHAATVMLGCLLNLDAVIQALRGPDGAPHADVQFACSGTDGATALEDVYVAGLLCAQLEGPRTDAARVAEAVARAYSSPLEALADSVDAIALRSAGLAADIADCARVSTLDVVARVIASTAGAAVAVSSTAARPRDPHRQAVDTGYTVGI